MATITTTFSNDLDLARLAVASLNLKGQRPSAVAKFLDAKTDDDREAVVEALGAGLIRRGLRQFARTMERKGDQAGADVFWALRDDIDESDDSVFRVESVA